MWTDFLYTKAAKNLTENYVVEHNTRIRCVAKLSEPLKEEFMLKMKAFLVITQLFYALSLIYWLIFWAMSAMMFDGGVYVWNSLLYFVITVYPVAILVCSIVAWVQHARKPRMATIFNLIPMLWVIVYLFLMVVYM